MFLVVMSNNNNSLYFQRVTHLAKKSLSLEALMVSVFGVFLLW